MGIALRLPLNHGSPVFQCLAAIGNFRFLEQAESRSGWNQVTKDHVFFQADQLSTLPANAASVRTLVVSWKLAAEIKLLL